LARIIRDYHFDIVQTFHFASDTYGAIIAKLCNGPIVVSSRRDMNLYKSKLQTSVCRITNRFIDRFITVSDAVSQNIIRAEKVSPGRVFRLYNGVDHSEFSKTDNAKIRKFKNSLGIPENSFVVGTISNFLPVKGYDTFFTAIAEVAHVIDGLKVLAVGDGPLLEGMQQRCRRDEHLRDRVIFPGLVPNVRDYISAMDVACLASRSEGFSNAILEKMAIGKPVIATDVGGNRELVLDGVSGFLVPPSNPEKMAQSILRLFDDSALRRQMGENARKRIESDFTLEKMIANVEAFYSALCEEKQNGKH
jgi:glycosyltransferase involved in cell wall biosynthesis